MKVIIAASFLALLVSYAAGECNNMCSGHGVCGPNDSCICYRNWRGNDCSERTCQFGISFINTPQGDLNHNGVVDQPPSIDATYNYEIQTITLTPSTTTGVVTAGDDFTLSYEGITTASNITIAPAANVAGGAAGASTTAASVLTALQALVTANPSATVATDFTIVSTQGTSFVDGSGYINYQISVLLRLSSSGYAASTPSPSFPKLLVGATATNTNNAFATPTVTAYQQYLLVFQASATLASGSSFKVAYYPQSGPSPLLTSSITLSTTASTTASNVATALAALATSDYTSVIAFGVAITNGEVIVIALPSSYTQLNKLDVMITSSTGNTNLAAIVQSASVREWVNTVVTQWAPMGTWESLPRFQAQESHAYMECSNKGLCDRASGECVCFPGYEGSACQRTVCPNSCSGHGVCRNINDLTQSLTSYANEPYPLWDGLKNQACVCDPGFGGVDCSLRLCPRNADPLIPDVVYETQQLVFDKSVTTSFKLLYTDTFGEQWTTSTIAVITGGTVGSQTTSGTQDYNIATALTSIPNGVIQAVTVSCTYATNIYTCNILFSGLAGSIMTGNAGDLTTLTATVVTGSGTVTVNTPIPGTNSAEECSFRGLCQYDTGLCKCFRGYRTDDCHLQHALAY